MDRSCGSKKKPAVKKMKYGGAVKKMKKGGKVKSGCRVRNA